MVVKDVLEKVVCVFDDTPVEIFNNKGGCHEDFTYGDYKNGDIPECYLNEKVKSWKQFERVGAVQIILD